MARGLHKRPHRTVSNFQRRQLADHLQDEIDWQDTWLYAVGMGYKVTPEIEITAGAAYESSAAVNGSGTTLSADAEKTTVGFGVLTDVPGIGRVSMSYAHVFVHEAPVLAANPASGTLEGHLDGRMDTFGASLTIPWWVRQTQPKRLDLVDVYPFLWNGRDVYLLPVSVVLACTRHPR